MRYFDSIKTTLDDELPKLTTLSETELVGRFWQPLLESGAIDGFGGGDRISQVQQWLSKTLDEAFAELGKRGREMRLLFENEQTLEDFERLTLLISFIVVMVPSLRDWPIAELLALVVFEIRRRGKSR